MLYRKYEKFEKFDAYHVCNSSIGAEAFKFYHKNRYATYQECVNPCKIMTVTTISKFKLFKSTYDVEIYVPRQVEVTREVFVKSVLSLGKVLYWLYIVVLWFSLVAEIGGFLGMILGVSIMDMEAFSKRYAAPTIRAIKKMCY